MTLAPSILINFLAGYRANRLRQRFKAEGNGVASQQACLSKLLAQFARTEYGRAHDLRANLSYDDFRRTVPLRVHEHILPYIDRMALGEKDVLWPGYCRFFAATAGTTTGTPRRLPVTAEMLAHYRAGLRDTLLAYAGRAKHAGVFLGRHLHLGGSTQLREVGVGYEGNLDAFASLSLSRWSEANLYAPSAAIAHLPDGPEKAAAIADAMVGRDVTLLAGAPASMRVFADAVRARASKGKVRVTNLSAVWPNLECFLHTGAPLGLFTEELHSLLGNKVNYHELYAAAEGVFATQDGDPAAGLRLLTDAGIFYEFIPVWDYSEAALSQLGTKCLPLEKVQANMDYVLVVTTPGGLCRYVVGDIVRFVSTEPPRLQFRGRTQLQLAAFGENIGERELTETLLEVCANNDWSAVNFHVAPVARNPVPPHRTGHEWWIELRPGTVKTPTGPILADEIDAALMRRNIDYAARRNKRGFSSPIVYLVMPGIFETWAKEYSPLGGTSRMPRCRSDRLIADQLMTLTRFHTGGAKAALVSANVTGSGQPFR